ALALLDIDAAVGEDDVDVVTAAARERLQSGEEQDALASGDVVDGAARVDEVERPGGKVVGRVALHPVDLDAVGAREALRLVEPGRRDVHARDVARSEERRVGKEWRTGRSRCEG